MTKKPAWSFSQFKNFEQCPKQFFHVTVMKEHPYVETAATRYGKKVHAAFEHYVSKSMELPTDLQKFQPIMDSVDRMKGNKIVENKFGLRDDYTLTAYFGADVWFRGVTDFAAINDTKARILDYKTGTNVKYADPRQLELMSLGIFAEFPQVEEIKGALVYVDAGEMVSKSVTSDDIPKLQKKWSAEYDMILAAHESDTWNPKPSGLCKRHCPVVECVHNGANN